MSRLSRMFVAAVVATFFVVLLIPETVLWAAATIRSLGGNLWNGATGSIPQPVLIVLLMLFFLIVSFGVIFGIVRLFTSYGASKGEQIATWYERVTPDTPQTKALVFMGGFVVVFIVGIAVFAPAFAASLTENTGADDFLDDLEEGNYGDEVEQLFADDAVRSPEETVSLRRPNDTDGDGLPDAWEAAGETPNGIVLPGSSTGRMDLYVQIGHGEGVAELSDRERDRLRAIWRDMPVENPDGSTGIDLQIVETEMSTPVGAETSEQVDRYYTEANLGPRHCLYRQVVLGQLDTRQRIGLAETPGYAVIFDGSRYQGYDGEEPFRSVMITHGLLHTVVGEVDGADHVAGGYLDYPMSGNERLSPSVADQLEEEGFRTTTAYRDACHEQGS